MTEGLGKGNHAGASCSVQPSTSLLTLPGCFSHQLSLVSQARSFGPVGKSQPDSENLQTLFWTGLGCYPSTSPLFLVTVFNTAPSPSWQDRGLVSSQFPVLKAWASLCI